MLEAYDIRSLGVIDTENRHGVQLDAPVILDSPLIYGLRRERADSRRIRFSIRNGRRKLCLRVFEIIQTCLKRPVTYQLNSGY